MNNWVKSNFGIRAKVYDDLVKNKKLIESVISAYRVLLESINSGGKTLIFGNGGSAAEAQHFAAELVCMFQRRRRALPAVALTTDSSILTAQGNDFGFDSIFSRQIEALCKAGDVVIGLTTSDVRNDGHSRNLLNAFEAAVAKEAKTIGFFSTKTERLLAFVDVPIIIPATNTALIQEVHLAIIHILCDLVEKAI